MRWLALALVVHMGCGRIGYDPLGTIDGDGGSIVDASIDAAGPAQTGLTRDTTTIIPTLSLGDGLGMRMFVANTQVGVVWRGLSSVTNIEYAQVDLQGQVTRSPRFITSTQQASVDPVAFQRNESIGVLYRHRSGNGEIRFFVTDEAGDTISPEVTLSTGPDAVSDPQLVFDGDQYVAMWHALTNGGSRQLYTAAVTTDGVIASAAAALTPMSERRSGDIRWTGSGFWVTFATLDGTPWIQAMDANRQLLSSPIQLNAGTQRDTGGIRVAYSPTGPAVVWAEQDEELIDGLFNAQLYFAKLSLTGEIEYGPMQVSTNHPGGGVAGRVVWVGDNRFAIFWSGRSGTPLENHLLLGLIEDGELRAPTVVGSASSSRMGDLLFTQNRIVVSYTEGAAVVVVSYEMVD